MGDLRALQRQFLALVTGRGSVADSLAEQGLGPEAVSAFVRGDERLGAVDRLDIYADMYFLRLEEALREDFPKLAAVLEAADGEGAFATLALDYLQACPPDGPGIRDVGARLPDFLRRWRGPAGASDRPWLRDLAALEWARADVFDRADAEPLTLDDLRALDGEGFAALALRPVPAAALVDVSWAVDDVWRRIEHDEPAGEPVPEARRLVVWRVSFDVRHRAADPIETEVLTALWRGVRFVELCERLGEGRSEEDAAALVFQLLGGWAQEGLIVA